MQRGEIEWSGVGRLEGGVVEPGVTEAYDDCRLFVDGVGPAGEAEARLTGSRGYRRVDRSLRVTDGVWADVRKNKSIPREWDAALIARTPAFLTWPVTVEVYRDAGVDDQTMLDAVRRLVADLRAVGAEVVVAADFEEEL
ncbi:hypothetical protein ACIA3K_08490 [Micromonospora sp. NPDC051543]|uniref:hypothetical protein n=1 Tax=Micromonospora sp. NPDC051543 TaxID=3364287 RepID=UPI003788A58F